MDKYLDVFLENNKGCEIKIEEGYYVFNNPWCDNTFILKFKEGDDFKGFESLCFPKEFYAIYHQEEGMYEFFYAPIKNNECYIDRAFEFNYEILPFVGKYSEPTDIFIRIAKSFVEIDNSQTEYRNLIKFRDYYNQENLPDLFKRYFSDKKPINFFIKGPFRDLKITHIDFFKHVNFYMSYYDRKTPQIQIIDADDYSEVAKYQLPCLSVVGAFPNHIAMRCIDEVLLGLLTVAMYTRDLRLKYIFYYQVLEYCSYYYIEANLRRRLNNVIRNPDVVYNSEKYCQVIIDEFRGNIKYSDDGKRLGKLINDYCAVSDIKIEIMENIEFFKESVEFDGGFKIVGIIKDPKDLDSSSSDIIDKIKLNIEKIRNVLVHVRESRENKVILPSKRNNMLLAPYTYLIRRIAEIVALRFGDK